ncbi:MAG: hypothetical protein K0R39_3656 [Symbiobacteriaceae bacterium]|jgi:hypothetical protein|nr:hypothetical protein [Symbiobacteriaceae bacterium]
MSQPQWDLFISHASEDKERFVRPLARLLSEMGVRVWYDEFTLTMGDSLSRSIDKGLASSRYGIVVISPAFMKKKWPEYELRGLVAMELGADRKLLPVWHNVSRDEVLEFSPPLADKVALDTTKHDAWDISLRVASIVRPDIHTMVMRHLAMDRLLKGVPYVEANVRIQDIKKPPIRHKTLNADMLVRIKIVQRVLFELYPVSLEETINNFRRDLRPWRELHVWERIVAAFLDITANQNLPLEHKREIFDALLLASMKSLTAEDFARWQHVTPGLISSAVQGVIPEIVDPVDESVGDDPLEELVRQFQTALESEKDENH